MNNELLIDTLLQIPTGFEVGGRHYYYYPLTYGVSQLVARFIADLKVNYELLQAHPEFETLRIVQLYDTECSHIFALRSARTKEDIFGNSFEKRREQYLSLTLDEKATLITMALQPDPEETLLRDLGIDKELNALQAATGAKKKDLNALTFGGVSVYGSLVDAACERYGWTLDYVVWGISFANLRLLLADYVKTVYLTDKERRNTHIPTHGKVVRADKLTKEELLTKYRLK